METVLISANHKGYGDCNFYNSFVSTLKRLLFSDPLVENELIRIYRNSSYYYEDDLIVMKEACGEISLRLIKKSKLYENNIMSSTVIDSRLIMKASENKKSEIKKLKEETKYYIKKFNMKPVVTN